MRIAQLVLYADSAIHDSPVGNRGGVGNKCGQGCLGPEYGIYVECAVHYVSSEPYRTALLYEEVSADKSDSNKLIVSAVYSIVSVDVENIFACLETEQSVTSSGKHISG